MNVPEFDACVDLWLGKGDVELGVLHPGLASVPSGVGELLGRFVSAEEQRPADMRFDSTQLAAIHYETGRTLGQTSLYAVLSATTYESDPGLHVNVMRRNVETDRRTGIMRLGSLTIAPEGSGYASRFGMLKLDRL
jgi:hypothetical protein